MSYVCSTGKAVELWPPPEGVVFYNEIKNFNANIKVFGKPLRMSEIQRSFPAKELGVISELA